MKTAAERLEHIRSTRDQGELTLALSDPSHLVVEAAAKRLTDEGAATALLQSYLRLHEAAPRADPGCWARMAVIEAMSRLQSPRAEQAAKLAMDTVQVERVGTGLVDTATGLRAAAARAIGALGDLGGTAVLAVKLAYPGQELGEVLAECMDALAALKDERIVGILNPWLKYGNPYLVSVAATAMAQGAGKAALQALVASVPGAVADAREAVVYAIASVRSEETRAALQSLAESEDQVVSKAAKSMLGAVG